MFDTNLYIHLAFGSLLAVLAFLISLILSRLAPIIDKPNHRSAHSRMVPRAGGISIVVTFYIGFAVSWYLGYLKFVELRLLLGFLLSTFLIALVSLVDDITEQSATVKLITQIIAIGIVLYLGIHLDVLAIPIVGYVQLGHIGYLVSFFWILGLTNAYNFMDGLDGLAGGVAVIVSLFFLIITYSEGSTFVYVISYSVLAGAFGFWVLNYPPARIILGDVGSAFLGFCFAVLAIIASRFDESRTSFLVMPLLLFNFIYDTFFTFLRRLISREKVLEAHRGHLYQLLNRAGYSHLEVVLIQYCMVFLQGIGALILVKIPGNERMLVFVPFIFIQIVYTILVFKFARSRGVDTGRVR